MLLTDYRTRLADFWKACPPAESIPALRELCRTDLYFLLRYGCNRPDIERQWLFDRCREVQQDPDGKLDLWSREHYKSTIITFGKSLQDILITHGDGAEGDEACIGIFSHTRPIAKAFLRQIKREAEYNVQLREWFPDVLWQAPAKESPKWSEDEGIIFKRRSNPKEATVEAWGLIDGQPTSKHYNRLVYDDVVTRESVTTPDQIKKTTEAMELSYNLGANGGLRRAVGTRYHFNDSYRTLMERGTFSARVYTATVDGSVEGEPVLLTRQQLADKRRDMGPYTFGCQMLQNPKSDKTQGFKREWLRYFDKSEPQRLAMRQGQNLYMLVDAANEKRVTSDYTSIWLLGLAADGNYYALDMVRDRLNLTERGKLVMALHRKWKPFEVRYEKYGMMADITYIKELQDRENYRFEILEVGGQTPKPDRIKRLIPLFEQGKIYLPIQLVRQNYERRDVDLPGVFVEEEFAAFPVGAHDDMLDSLARIAEPDMPLAWPEAGWSSSEIDYGNKAYV